MNDKDKVYTLWTLNKASDLLDPFIEEYRETFEKNGIKIGNRQRSIEKIMAAYKDAEAHGERKENTIRFQQNRFERGDFNHSLMYEGGLPEHKNRPEKCNEYFVPIPLKCIGDFYRRYKYGPYKQELDKVRTTILEKIVKNDDNLPNDLESLLDEKASQYWEKGLGQEHRIRMATPFSSCSNASGYIGLYELLLQNENNILIGYSQGGLVARYLAFLDEKVFKMNRIAAVITLQSANYGSTMASGIHGDAIVKDIFRAIEHAGYKPKEVEGCAKGVIKHETMTLHDFLFGGYFFISKVGVLKSLADFFNTALKWTTGLRDGLSEDKVGDTAFRDLDPLSIGRDYSVLNAVNRKESELQSCTTYAVVATKHDLKSALLGLLGSIKALKMFAAAMIISILITVYFVLWYMVPWAVRIFNGNTRAVTAIKFGLVLVIAGFVYLYAKRIREMFRKDEKYIDQINEAYSNAMTRYNDMWRYFDDGAVSDEESHKDIRDYLSKHAPPNHLKEHHDFVIPSSSQFILSSNNKDGNGNLKNHFINKHASHLSGGTIGHKAASATTEKVFEWLGEIVKDDEVGKIYKSTNYKILVLKYNKKKRKLRRRI